MGLSLDDGGRKHLALRIERLAILIAARVAPEAEQEAALRRNRDARLNLLREYGGSVPSLALLESFGLSMFELDVLELSTGMQLDHVLRGAVWSAIPAIRESGLTVGTAVALLANTIEARIDLGQELQRSRLWSLGLLRRPTGRGIDMEIVPTRRAIAAVLGHTPLTRLPWWVAQGTPSPRAAFEIDPARTAKSLDRGGAIVIAGPTGVGKTEVARAIAGAWDTRFLVVDVMACVDAVGSRALGAELVELIEDAGLEGRALVLDNVHRHLLTSADNVEIVEAAERANVRLLLCTDAVADLPPGVASRATLRITLRGVRGQLATHVYREAAQGGEPVWLSDETQVRPRQLRQAAALSRALDVRAAEALQATHADSSDLLEPARTQLRLSDLAVSDDVRDQIRELIGAIRTRNEVLEDWGLGRRLSRGRGIAALFDGEPGTGKTMAAEVVAFEVGLPLRRVNIASLVDKYIGETEKNLQKLFVEARSGSYILLFDEADSLFGTRTDVKGSNDRYANLEVNVLLQLMEEHGGIVLLTTNLRKNVDQAFLRRLGYKLTFELPDEELREQIWTGMLPQAACDASVDAPRLAKAFPLSGGDIKSAVLRAAYRAASTARKISMADLVECAELECQAKGRVVTFRSA